MRIEDARLLCIPTTALLLTASGFLVQPASPAIVMQRADAVTTAFVIKRCILPLLREITLIIKKGYRCFDMTTHTKKVLANSASRLKLTKNL